MKIQATIRLKVPCSSQIASTMKEFSRASQFAYDYARNNKINSLKSLHNAIYYEIRKFSRLPSQLCCKAIKSALETKKACRNRHVDFSKELSIQYDKRSYSLDFSGNCSLSTIEGRIRSNLHIPQYYLDTYKDWEIRSATLSKNGKDLFLNVTVCREADAPTFNNESDIVGIDLGINNLATTSQGKFFKGMKNPIAKLQGLRSKLQSKGTKSAKRHLRKLSGRQKRFMRAVNHEVSKRIVSSMNAGDIVVMENLHGIRERRRGKALNRLISNWSFFQLRQFIKYKAIRKGITFVTVSPEYTSRMCNRCHEIFSKRPNHAGFFRCLNCGYSCNADFNASLNLRKRVDALRNTFGLPVNQPIVGNHHNLSSDKPTTLVVGS